ncbi:hypothetical protein ABVK25_000908 [Lepraria finkii]|uniref:Uncharacterized protein n=1 Tax=Lepraria finkii TaxID=1340010 RepID=A0ABR4BP99_9LECA
MAPQLEWNIYTGENSFMSWAKILDCGDAPLTFLDNTVALKQLEKAHKSPVERQRTHRSLKHHVSLPSVEITLPLCRPFAASRWGKVSVIHFDSHLDTWDPKVLGGGITQYIILGT